MRAWPRSGASRGEAESRPIPGWEAHEKFAGEQSREESEPSFPRRVAAACAGSCRPVVSEEHRDRPPRFPTFSPPPSLAQLLLLSPADEERGTASPFAGKTREREERHGEDEFHAHADERRGALGEDPGKAIRRESGPERDAKKRRRGSHLEFFLSPKCHKGKEKRNDSKGGLEAVGDSQLHAQATASSNARIGLPESSNRKKVGKVASNAVLGGSTRRPLLTTSSLFFCSPVSEMKRSAWGTRRTGDHDACSAPMPGLRGGASRTSGVSAIAHHDAVLENSQAMSSDVGTGDFREHQARVDLCCVQEGGVHRRRQADSEAQAGEGGLEAHREETIGVRTDSVEPRGSDPDRNTQVHATAGWSRSRGEAVLAARGGCPLVKPRDRMDEIDERERAGDAGETFLVSGRHTVESLCGVEKTGETKALLGLCSENRPREGPNNDETQWRSTGKRRQEWGCDSRNLSQSNNALTTSVSRHSGEPRKTRMRLLASAVVRGTHASHVSRREACEATQPRQFLASLWGSPRSNLGSGSFSPISQESRGGRRDPSENRANLKAPRFDSPRNEVTSVSRSGEAEARTESQCSREGCTKTDDRHGLPSRLLSSSLSPWTPSMTRDAENTKVEPSAVASLRKHRSILFRIVGGRVVRSGFSFPGSRRIAPRSQHREAPSSASSTSQARGVGAREPGGRTDLQSEEQLTNLGSSCASSERAGASLGTQTKDEKEHWAMGRFEDVLLRLAADSRLSLRALQRQFYGTPYGIESCQREKRPEETGKEREDADGRKDDTGMSEEAQAVEQHSEAAHARRQRGVASACWCEEGSGECEQGEALRDSLRAFLRRRRLARAAKSKRTLLALDQLGSFEISVPSSSVRVQSGKKDESICSCGEGRSLNNVEHRENGRLSEFTLLDSFGDPVPLDLSFGSAVSPFHETRLCPETLQERLVASQLWEPSFTALQIGPTEQDEERLLKLWDEDCRKRKERHRQPDASMQAHMSRATGRQCAAGVTGGRVHCRPTVPLVDPQTQEGTEADTAKESPSFEVCLPQTKRFSLTGGSCLLASAEDEARRPGSEKVRPVLSELSGGEASSLVMHLCFWAACRVMMAHGPRVSAKALLTEGVARILSVLPVTLRALGKLHSAMNLILTAGGYDRVMEKKEDVGWRVTTRGDSDSVAYGMVEDCLDRSTFCSLMKTNEEHADTGHSTGRETTGLHGNCETDKSQPKLAQMRKKEAPSKNTLDGTCSAGSPLTSESGTVEEVREMNQRSREVSDVANTDESQTKGVISLMRLCLGGFQTHLRRVHRRRVCGRSSLPRVEAKRQKTTATLPSQSGRNLAFQCRRAQQMQPLGTGKLCQTKARKPRACTGEWKPNAGTDRSYKARCQIEQRCQTLRLVLRSLLEETIHPAGLPCDKQDDVTRSESGVSQWNSNPASFPYGRLSLRELLRRLFAPLQHVSTSRSCSV
ncbi:hypothetical protein TGPRC2_280450 [Toxoplasma gondii TgCatPRC2]|uniref:Uncharacterized protein n=1 Tax=Toxoplasma gondii TgCatPRC2 TaxID=1130821 RepID=A0A151H3W4_TOXGO|nr:hypothetical protein TGPRC2_280450 [Toxoplasma gondii TgCatPRC2]